MRHLLSLVRWFRGRPRRQQVLAGTALLALVVALADVTDGRFLVAVAALLAVDLFVDAVEWAGGPRE